MPTGHGPVDDLGAWTIPNRDADGRRAGSRPPRSRWTSWSSVVIAAGIAASTSYALLASDPYRDLPEATLIAARAQDVGSVLVAVLLLLLRRRPSARVHLVRLGLLAYVAYSYSIYLIGVPMNRVFLIYVVLVKILTLFTALWAGVLAGLAMGAEVHLAADAGPSVVMLGACAVLLHRWLRSLSPDESAFARSTIWGP